MGSADRQHRRFDIRLSGHVLETEVAAALGPGAVVRLTTRTVVQARLSEPAALQQLLRAVRSYGLEVVEVRRLGQHSVSREADRP